MNITTVKQVQVEKEINLKDIRSEIKRRHDLVMKDHRPKTYNQYIDLMKANKVEVIPCINKAEKLQGFRFEFDGYNLKGSEVHRSMSIGNIGKQMAESIGVKAFVRNNSHIIMGDKVVRLSTNLAMNILKQALKREITRGFGY